MASTDQAGSWRFAGREVREGSRELLVDGRPVPLERKPFEVLLCLLRHAGEVVTREELTEQVWAGRIVTDSVLSRTILKLRKALGDDDRAIIDTVHGYGYRLAAPVERIAGETGTASRLDFREGMAVPQRPHFLLEKRLGSGGYGEVWLARHEKTGDRRVFKFCSDAGELYALKREVTVFRLLKESLGPREDLVRIIDWEFSESPFFIEMEHEAGGNLLDFHERYADLLRVPLDTRSDIIARLAETVGAAHSVGVLHKDLKPANVLVNEDGAGGVRVRLTDFGSGHLLDPERLRELGITRAGFTRTQSGTDEPTSGTPLYMAPEVAAGQPPTVQSDIYALGVLLYQIVCGDFTRPLTAGWEADVEDELLREDIAATANVEPGRRLPSAKELARRLYSLEERREALEARREAERQAERQARALQRARVRRRWLAGLATVLALGAALSTTLYLEAREAREEARKQAAAASALNEFLTEDLLGAADPFRAAEPDMTVRDAADRAARDLSERFGESPLQRASIRAALGEIYSGLGEVEAAREQFERARAIYSNNKGPGSAEALSATAQLGRIEGYLENYGASRQVLENGLSSSRRYLGDQSAQSLWFRTYLAWLDYREARHEEAIEAFQVLLEELHRRQDRLPELRDFLLEWLMLAYIYQGDYEKGEAIAEKLLELRGSTYGEGHPATLWAMRYLGAAKRELGDHEAAESLLTRSMEEMEERLGEDHPDITVGTYELAILYLHMERSGEAVPLLEKVVEAKTKQVGPDHHEVHYALNALAYAHSQAGQPGRAVGVYERLLDSATAAFGREHPDVVVYRANLAEAHLGIGNISRAEGIMREVLADAGRVFAPDHFRIGTFKAIMGRVQLAQGRHEEARRELESALAVLTAALGEDHARVKRVRERIEALDGGRGEPPQAGANATGSS